MANISSSFTQLLPTELYVAGISTNVSGSYTYNGPETFDVHVVENCTIQKHTNQHIFSKKTRAVGARMP